MDMIVPLRIGQVICEVVSGIAASAEDCVTTSCFSRQILYYKTRSNDTFGAETSSWCKRGGSVSIDLRAQSSVEFLASSLVGSSPMLIA
jgi:hypothetical protein